MNSPARFISFFLSGARARATRCCRGSVGPAGVNKGESPRSRTAPKPWNRASLYTARVHAMTHKWDRHLRAGTKSMLYVVSFTRAPYNKDCQLFSPAVRLNRLLLGLSPRVFTTRGTKSERFVDYETLLYTMITTINNTKNVFDSFC